MSKVVKGKPPLGRQTEPMFDLFLCSYRQTAAEVINAQPICLDHNQGESDLRGFTGGVGKNCLQNDLFLQRVGICMIAISLLGLATQENICIHWKCKKNNALEASTDGTKRYV